MKAVFILFALLLSACSTATITNCPPLVEYTQDDQNKLSQELETLPDDSQVVRWIGDYIGLRDVIRACHNETS